MGISYPGLLQKEMEIDMKKIWTGAQIALCVCAMFGWWGVLYPELVLTTDTYRICDDGEREEQEIRDRQNPSADQDIYWNLLKADKNEIRFRSKLLIEWNKFMEALDESDQNGTAP